MLRVSTFTDLSTAGLGQSKDKSKCPNVVTLQGGTRHQPLQGRGVRFISPSSTCDQDEPGEGKSSTTSNCGSNSSEVEWQVNFGPSPSDLLRCKPPSCLLMASSAGDAQWVQQALASSRPEEVNQLGPEGLAPLHMAAKHGHVACLEVLLSSKAVKPAIGTTPDGRTALHLAVDAKRQRVQCLKLLLRSGVPVNQADWNRSTPLHYAARLGRVGSMMALLDGGADTTAEDKLNRQPVDVAKWCGKGECVRRLRAVTWAAEKTHAEDVKRLQSFSTDLQGAQRNRRQKLEQSIRGEEAYSDWLSTKGLPMMSSTVLARRHTTSSLLRTCGQSSDEVRDALTSASTTVSLPPSRGCSRLSSKFSSMWSVASAPSSLGCHGIDHDRITRLTSPSLPSMVIPDEPTPPAIPKPIKVSFQNKHQHKDFAIIKAKKSPHSGTSPKSKPKRRKPSTSLSSSSSSGSSRKKVPKRHTVHRASTPHPGKYAIDVPTTPQQPPSDHEEEMAVSEAVTDLPQVRIEELLLKDRHQLPALKPLAWSSNHQLQHYQHDAQSSAAVPQPSVPLLPASRPLRANSLRLAILRTSHLEIVEEEGESDSGSVSDIDAYLGPTHSCLQLQCSDSMESACTSDVSLCSTDLLDRMSLSDE